MKFRRAYDPPFPGPVLDEFEPTLTQQQFAEDCDINEILRRSLHAGGLTPDADANNRLYADVADAPVDFQTALNLVNQAQESFSELDPRVRERFSNDPGRWMSFMGSLETDADAFDEAVRLKLIVPQADPAAVKAAELAAAVDADIAFDEAKRSRQARSRSEATERGAPPKGE